MSKTLSELGLMWVLLNQQKAESQSIIEEHKSPEKIDVNRKRETIKSEGQNTTPT